jgi:UV DNA damage endonuclease
MKALVYCQQNNIGSFRINSQILPLKTHPTVGYDISELPDYEIILKTFKACGDYSRHENIRTTFHPDQFIVLSSPNPEVVSRSIADLEYQAEVAEWVNADVINIHAGGAYGDKSSAIKRLINTIENLSEPIKTRLTIENDDRSYSPEDLFPVCAELNMPLVYDVHHHRCLTDSISIEEATVRSVETWNRETLFHISSPINGWDKSDRRKHHDYININEFPRIWNGMDLTVEVEAKAKELAVSKLMQEYQKIYS